MEPNKGVYYFDPTPHPFPVAPEGKCWYSIQSQFARYSDFPAMEVHYFRKWADAATANATRIIIGDWASVRRIALILWKRGYRTFYIKPHYSGAHHGK